MIVVPWICNQWCDQTINKLVISSCNHMFPIACGTFTTGQFMADELDSPQQCVFDRLLLNGTSALFRILLPSLVEIKQMRHVEIRFETDMSKQCSK